MADSGSGGWEFAAGFFIGGVVGGLLGAAAALLLAPQAGEDTRAMLREKSIELKERAEDATVDARRRAEEAAELARRRMEEATGEARERTATIRESAKMMVDERIAQVKDAIEKGKEDAEKKMAEVRQSLQAESAPKSPSA